MADGIHQERRTWLHIPGRRTPPALAILLLACCRLGTAVKVSDIGNAMSSEMKYSRGCYKLLNATGAVGCEAASEQTVVGVLAYYENIVSGLTANRVIVVPMANFDTLMQRILTDAAFSAHVMGVLVDPRVVPTSHSTAAQFPGAAYAPYANGSAAASGYSWNPSGSGLNRQHFTTPVFLMTPALAEDTVWRALYNEEQDWFSGALHVAEMQLTMSGQVNSLVCMALGTCQPVGGYSTWTALPPLNGSGTSPTAKPITLITSQVDSNSFFHDVVSASDGPVSGLIAMLGALQILSAANQSSSYTRTLVFAALAGEPWDYMGSRRLLWEMYQGTAVTQGFNLSLIDQVIEVGQIGQASSTVTGGPRKLYMHSQSPNTSYGDVTALAAALQMGATLTTETSVAFVAASTTNPGIPPSSLNSFLRVKPNISGIVITEFDTHFTNKYYQSEYDLPNNTVAASMVATAVALARALHFLATGSNTSAPALNVTLATTKIFVNALSECLQYDSPGLQCALAEALIAPGYVAQDGVTSYAVRHYIGVLPQIPSDPQDPYLRADVSRFLYNLMGTLTAVTSAGPVCAPKEVLCANPNQVCIGWHSGVKDVATIGRCLNTTVFYVPAVSTKFWFGTGWGYYGWHLVNNSWAWEQSTGWPQDPMWTESNWPDTTPYVRVYQSEAYSVEVAVLVSGIALSVATGVVSVIMRKAYERQLKNR